MTLRADLHCHSKFSDLPDEWLLRRLGAHESYTEPRTLYDLARRRGMDLVTITDHNDIRGALEIAHLPGTFVSVEITATFPEDGCRVHVLAYGITESQFAEIQTLRENIYELQAYLRRQAIAHSVAHPLHRVNNKLTLWHLERLLLLFPCFEVINGSRHPGNRDLMEWLLARLTPGLIADLSAAHDLEPVGASPWCKGMTGGSDDHGGLFIGRSRTVAPDVGETVEFLDCLRRGLTRPEGSTGTAHGLAHTLYTVVHQFGREQFLGRAGAGRDLLAPILKEFFDSQSEVTSPTLGQRVRRWVRAASKKKSKDRSAEWAFKEVTIDALRDIVDRDWSRDDLLLDLPGHDKLNRETFLLASQLMNRLLFEFTRKGVKKFLEGSLFGSLQALSAVGPVLLAAAPYLVAFHQHHKDQQFLTGVRSRFANGEPSTPVAPKRAWFTDTLGEVNGVAATLSAMSGSAARQQADLTLVASSETPVQVAGKLKNFPPIGTIAVQEYEYQPITFPPVLNVVDYCEREGFHEIIISTTLTMGLTGLATARLLGLPAIGIYHTDIPQYVHYYTQDEQMAEFALRVTRWFYGQMDRVYVPSQAYLQELAGWGFPADRLRLFPKAVDVEGFHPRWRDPVTWYRYGANGESKLLYVGRLAREKDLDVLVEAYRRVRAAAPATILVVVGDGPYRAELERALNGLPVIFTGFLSGEALSRAYASADLFIFPSTSDTFGNVVLEAQASGLPVIVSDAGGPQEIVRDGDTGLVIRRRDPEGLAAAIHSLLIDPARRQAMGAQARRHAEHRSWDTAFKEFWEDLADIRSGG
jgi:glycosyltransferase involved in cell wall biosynthesis